jgi:hypothetical protein
MLPWMRRHLLLAAPIFAGSMVLVSYLWFQTTPVLREYPITAGNLLLTMLLAMAGGTIAGSLGLRLAGLVESKFNVSRETLRE